ncbi:MAG: UDP-N-acetylglucosamine 2-epimerase (hydrolyzing) [Sedimentisphaerales bacterium]|nr:UDP-N-acetylglucosamine 2-epimerase (hydrolyzing) [Sedimentisphaerales bacterium]
MSEIRKVCVVIASRANYARIKYFMKAVRVHPRLQLQIIAGASALLYKFGMVTDIMEADGFEPDWRIHYLIEGENLTTQAKSTGMGIIELSTAFQELKPDVVVTVADRYETMATAVAASYMNIPVAHVQGGEISGNIDDSVRHAVTRLSHLHYPSTRRSAERLLQMGEESWRVHFTGCPSIDILTHSDLTLPDADYFRDRGTGIPFDPCQPYVMIVQHPVTTSFGRGGEQITETLISMMDLPMTKLVLWPNADAGSDDVAKAIRAFQFEHRNANYTYHINFSPEIYASLLTHARCLIGNSSSFIREGAFLGTPAVIVGDRQQGREHGANIRFCGYNRYEILSRVRWQIAHGPYPSETIFGTGDAGDQIAAHLVTARLDIRKRLVLREQRYAPVELAGQRG